MVDYIEFNKQKLPIKFSLNAEIRFTTETQKDTIEALTNIDLLERLIYHAFVVGHKWEKISVPDNLNDIILEMFEDEKIINQIYEIIKRDIINVKKKKIVDQMKAIETYKKRKQLKNKS